MLTNRANITEFDGTGYATPQQAADFFKVSRTTLMKWAERSNSVVRSGRIVRIDIEKMDTAFRSGKLS